MIRPKALANSLTIVWLAGYTICAILAFIVPDLLFGIANSWFHALNLDPLRAAASFSLGTFLVGIISFGLVIWVGTYSIAVLYNRFK